MVSMSQDYELAGSFAQGLKTETQLSAMLHSHLEACLGKILLPSSLGFWQNCLLAAR